MWDRWPTAGVTAHFDGSVDYDQLVEHLIGTGAARDRGMIYFDARLSDSYPTVEVRVCDVQPTVAEAVTLAGLSRALVATCVDRSDMPRTRPELVRAAFWRAARFGMNDQLVDLRAEPRLVPAWTLVEELLDLVGDALDAAGDSERVSSGLAWVREHGTGSVRQRRVADGNPEGALEVTEVRR